MDSNDSNPICYGKSPGKLPACNGCIYLGSCRIYPTLPNPDSRKRNTSSYELMAGMEIVSDSNFPDNESEPEHPEYTQSEMIELVRFLCTIDDLTIELLDATLNGQARSAAEIGRAIGVTRQAVHRKLVDECCRHQELVGFFGLHLKRCRRILEKRKAREAKSRRRKKGLDQ